MHKLTTEEIIEPNVNYIVPDGTALPEEISKTLMYFIGHRVYNSETGKTGTQYSIPAYLAREWLEKYAQEEKEA